MSKTLTIVLPLAVFLLVHTDCSSSQWMVARCAEDGTSIRVPRKANTSYRIYGSRYESGYRSAVVALRSTSSRRDVSDSVKNVLKDFRTYLDKERTAVQSQLRKSVLHLQKDPCDSLAKKDFHFLLENIEFNAQQLRKIAVACKDTSAELRNLLHAYRRDQE